MKKIELEDRYNFNQKLTFIIYIGAPFLIGIYKLYQMDLNYKGYIIMMILILGYFFLVSVAFLKRGFLKKDSDLYLGSFFLGKLFFKKKIDISKTPKLSLLKFNSRKKFIWFSDAKPDLAEKFLRYEINILNEKHTKRTPILNLTNAENVERALDFLTTNFNLEREKYNPRFR